MKLFRNIFIGVACLCGCLSCEDNMDSEHYYTFTGEMMSDYIKSRPEYSDFASILKRADMLDLLSSYGHYTCFLPSNTAFDAYFRQMNIDGVEGLSDGMCDTIARTHLIGNMFTTMEMMDGALNTANMNRQYLQISHENDANNNMITVINKTANLIFELQDDSVENGIVHPIDAVIESYSRTLPDVIASNPNLSLFAEALKATGLNEVLQNVRDESYNRDEKLYRYVSHTWTEVAVTPDERKIGFTVFAEPDSIFEQKGIDVDAPNRLELLYNYAAEKYKDVYKDEVGQPYWGFDQLTDERNPLYRFMAYHIVTRDVKGENLLTGRPLVYKQIDVYSMGIHQEKMNPTDWYETLLPRTMLKFERLTVNKPEYRNAANSVEARHYVNRRDDEFFNIRGAEINPMTPDTWTDKPIDANYDNIALNGMYFYIDDVLLFDDEARNAQNCRIRMDFSTIFPEIMTNGIRQNGSPEVDDANTVADETFKNGKNYYFPDGYLANVTMRGSFELVYRRPHINFWSYAGDEFNLFGDYDFEFRLPPVPFTDEWQIRLGFCALETRGMAQIYLDGKPQGIPLDMRKFLNHGSVLGNRFLNKDQYDALDEAGKAEDQKNLKNLGYYRGPYGGFHTNGDTRNEFVGNERTHRVILYQGPIDANSYHTLRIRCASKGKLGNNNEFMIDYLELVPKSVWGTAGAGEMEDDL